MERQRKSFGLQSLRGARVLQGAGGQRLSHGPDGMKAEHLVDETAMVRSRGIAPCYVKSHSQGEYVFDHGWAEAYHRAGGRYYPKLQTSVPFTPVTGPRLFSASAETRALLAKGLVSVCNELKTSSAHITFLPEFGLGDGGQGPLAAAAGHPVPLAKSGLRIFRRVPCEPFIFQAEEYPQGAEGGL